MLRWVLATLSQMMGSVPLSTLVICDGSASSGRRCGDARQALAHVVGRAVEIALQRELDVDLRAFVAARGVQPLDAFDARDLVLDDLRDARLDHVRGGAAITRLDVHHRPIDVGEFAQRQARDRADAEDEQQQRHHRREDRAPHRQVGDHHCAHAHWRCSRAPRVGFVRLAAPVIGRHPRPTARSVARTARAVAHLLRAFDDHALTGGEARRAFRRCRAGGRRCALHGARPCRRRPRTRTGARLRA